MSAQPTSQDALPVPPAPLAFSVSKLNLYLKCPMAFYFRHVLGLKSPQRSAQAFGSALHAGIAHSYRQKVESRKDLPLDEVKGFFAAEWSKQKDEVLWDPGEDHAKMLDEGVGLLEIYQAEVAPKIQPAIVEDLFEIRFENTDYSFRGVIDLVDKQSTLIIDHKTSAKAPSPLEAHKSLQLTAYALGNRVKSGVIEDGLAFDYLIRGRSPRIVRLHTNRTDEDLERFLKLLAHVATAVKENLFHPNSAHPYCTPKLCPFWTECEGGRRL